MTGPSASVPAGLIEWAVAARPLGGELESGDLHVVEPFPGGVLVAAIDALGHGQDAASVARLAAATLRAHAHESVEALIQRCHRDLRSTRGVVMSIASFSARSATVTWVGVGNVDGYLLRADLVTTRRREAIVSGGGVVGFQIPTLRPATIAVTPGDTLVLATDGITASFIEGRHQGPPQEIANDILARYGRRTDDALVLVARYEGAAR